MNDLGSSPSAPLGTLTGSPEVKIRRGDPGRGRGGARPLLRLSPKPLERAILPTSPPLASRLVTTRLALPLPRAAACSNKARACWILFDDPSAPRHFGKHGEGL